MLSQLQQVLPRAPADWLHELVRQLTGSTIDTPAERAAFIAQCAHESVGFTRFEENLNYSTQGLMDTWPRLFPSLEAAAPYARKPEAIANYVYDDANRLPKYKLGNVSPGDGWRYRGRGPIQITGVSKYIECGRGIGAALHANPELLLRPEIGIRSAIWYWQTRGLDRVDDDADVTDETRLVNGGAHGLVRRQAYRDQLFSVLTNP